MGKKKDILIYLWWTMMIAVILASAGCTKYRSGDLEKVTSEEKELMALSNSFFGILADTASNEAKNLLDERIKLGKMLFHDARLSKSGFISCNSCHNLATYGVDNLPTSVGHNWQIGNRNAPTVLNAAFHFTQFWDGRAKDVEEQATMPILNPVEMAIPHEEVSVEKIASIKEYVQMFSEAFPQEEKPLNLMNIGKAIGAFERTLITPSRFDQYLSGDAHALNAQEKRGLRAFIDANCQTCHMTPLLGGTIYQKFGIMKDYWELTWSDTKDKGRADITKNDDEMYFFKVPSLRNVARTYPYFHDGSIWDLKQAVSIMNELQVGKKLENNEVEDIGAFLESLTGRIPESALILPVLPPSGSLTPKPDMR